jgi:quinol monooxygenase YgiN
VILVRFKIQCQPDKTEQALAALQRVVPPSRLVDGAVHFDIGRDITDPTTFIATEVFEDRAALDRQEALPEVQEIVAQLGDLVSAPPEATVYHVASSEPWAG